VTLHRVLVIGMKAQTRYMIKAVSTTAGGSGSAEGSFMTGALPAQIVAGTIGVAEAGAYQPGWTLTNLMSGSGGFSSMYPAAAVMFDEMGVPIWYYINGTGRDSRGDVSVDVVSGNHILIGPIASEPPKEIDLGGTVIWRGPAQTATGGNIATHHAGKLTNGNYVIIREDHSSSSTVTGGRFDEVNASNQVVYQWNLTDYVKPPSGAQTDWCHANSLVVDLPNDVFYFACRYLGVYKVRRSDKTILWFLGAGGDFTFSPTNSVFKDEHDPELHSDGTMLIYDNGGLATGSTSGYHSRVVEYKLDEAMKRATVVWEFPGTFTVDAWYKNDWYTPYWGDADRLPNGNVLINAGIRDASKQTRIFEVRPSDGKVVWQMTLPANTGTYRAERITPFVNKL
jgi:Arylsulfotransferase (ASST)